MENKHFIGEHLFLSTGGSNSYYISAIRDPYTVIKVEENKIVIQEAECIFPYPRYYDTLPLEIRENPHGRIVTLFKSRSKKFKGEWVTDGGSYPKVATFGKWDYFPYLD